MTSASNGHPLDDLAIYALDALAPDERREVERHLTGCERCRDELAAHHETLASLASSEPPPPEVWQGVAAAIESVSASRAASPPRQARHSSPPARHLAPVAAPPRRRTAWVAVGLAAAAVLAVVAFVAGRQVGGPTRGVDDLAQAALAEPDAVVATLANPDGDEVARVVVGDEEAYVVLDDLAPLAPGRTYQLWSLDGSTPVSLGVIDRSEGSVAVALPRDARRLALTVEDASGATTPSGPIAARGTL